MDGILWFYDHPEEVVKNKISGYDKDSLGYKSAAYMTMCAPFSAGGLRSNVGDLAIWNKAIHDEPDLRVDALEVIRDTLTVVEAIAG